ncbi:50S ribosomal protein L13 [Candidatus Dependentiae bacterium]|nr:50S ribosomal protein L13 [Candidatus Dependentiae bacterium]
MNKAFFLHKEDRAPRWHVLSAKGKVLGRLATEIADLLRGKGKPEFTAHTDSGDYVVVTDCEAVDLTGNKWEGKTYSRYSGYKSGLKVETARQVLAKRPTDLVYKAVKGMLPKNKLSDQVLSKLRVYVGGEHPHIAQVGTK